MAAAIRAVPIAAFVGALSATSALYSIATPREPHVGGDLPPGRARDRGARQWGIGLSGIRR